MEIMLVLAIMASTAMVVILILPANNAQIRQAEKMMSLMEYAAQYATMTGVPTGLAMTPNEYQFVILATSQPLIPNNEEPKWIALPSARLESQGEFEDEEAISLSPQDLNKSLSTIPQIVFMPDGRVTVFNMQFSASSGDGLCCTLSSAGQLPLILKVITGED